MQIVIELSEKVYKHIQEYDASVPEYSIYQIIYDAIYNGTPLPKNHGRLIDADKIMRVDHIVLESAIDNAPTIIEAEGSDSE